MVLCIVGQIAKDKEEPLPSHVSFSDIPFLTFVKTICNFSFKVEVWKVYLSSPQGRSLGWRWCRGPPPGWRRSSCQTSPPLHNTGSWRQASPKMPKCQDFSLWKSKKVKIIQEGKTTSHCHRMTPKKIVTGESGQLPGARRLNWNLSSLVLFLPYRIYISHINVNEQCTFQLYVPLINTVHTGYSEIYYSVYFLSFLLWIRYVAFLFRIIFIYILLEISFDL